MLGVWGIEFGLWRPRCAEEPHAADHSVARGARLGRAAPARLLGAGTAQRAGADREGLGQAGGDERLLGRRDGAHPVDAGSLASRRLRLRRRWPRHAVRQARRCPRLDRALFRQPRPLSPRRALGLRGETALRASAATAREAMPRGRRRASHARTGRHFRCRTPPRSCGCRSRAGRHSSSVRISMRCARTIHR